MKNLIIIFCLVIAIGTNAQSFEGTITWTAKESGGKSAGNSSSTLTMKVKGTAIITVINGGVMNGMEMWFMDNDMKIVRVMRQQQMFVVLPPEAIAAAEKAVETGKFIKTGETTKILNYTCTKYAGETKSNGVTTKVSIWTTTAISDALKVLSHQPDPFGNPKLPAGVEGVPLKIEKVSPSGTSTMEVTALKNEKLDAEEFKIPASFKQMGK
jgi:hypothetical protein